MSRDEEKLIRMLFYECGGNYFEVIDDDGIRKPAIKTYLADVEAPTKEHGFDKEIWKVEISWRLLAKCLMKDNWLTKNLKKQVLLKKIDEYLGGENE